MKRFLIILLIPAVTGITAILLINLRVVSYSKDRLYRAAETVPDDYAVGIVLGARVGEDGAPSNTLYDRVYTAVEIYKAGKVKKLLMSGGGAEPAVMKKLAIDLGVNEADITVDELGLRTYDSCFRARYVFQVEKAIVFTQDYHLPRTVYLCHNMGIDSIGVDTKRRDYLGERYAWVREYVSRTAAWYDINFSSKPVVNDEQQPIKP